MTRAIVAKTITGSELWQRAALRAVLTATALGSRAIRDDHGAAMDPIMGGMLRWIRRMPPPSGPVEDMRAQYEMAARLTGARVLQDVRTEDFTIPAAHLPIPARRYVPPVGPVGTLVYFHGGGFALGSLDTHDRLCRVLAERCGLTVVSVGYRLAPEHPFPAATDDAVAALGWAGQVADGPLAVGGDSAGAQLAVVAMRGNPHVRIRAQFLLYPVVDMMGGYASEALFGEGFLLTVPVMAALLEAYVPPGVDRSGPLLSPLRAGPAPVPAVVVPAGFDPLRDQARAYAAQLEGQGVTVRLLEESKLIHGFADFAGVVPEARRAVLRAASALRDLMQDGAAA